MPPQRKPNRLPGFDYSEPGAYFVTVCTSGRRDLLGRVVVGADAHIGPSDGPADTKVELTAIGEKAAQYAKTIPGIEAYAIMPDHVHMILRIPAESQRGPMWASAPTRVQTVSEWVRSWKILTTKAAGKPIWQRSFYDRIIRNEREYWEIVRYMQQNPLAFAVKNK